MEKESVFQETPIKFKLNKEQVINSMPLPHYLSPMDFKDKNVEIRYRLFQIRNREFIELSMKKKTQQRKFLSSENKWIESTIDNKYDKYDKYIKNVIYSYLDN